MAGYVCPSCGKTSRLPNFCCGTASVQKGMYYCDKCHAQSNTSGNCCGTAMRQL